MSFIFNWINLMQAGISESEQKGLVNCLFINTNLAADNVNC